MPRAMPSARALRCERANLLQWRLAFHHDAAVSRISGRRRNNACAGNSLRVQAGIDFGWLCHLTPAQVVWLRHCAAFTLCGGLRSGTTFVAACVKRRRSTSSECSIPVNTVASSRALHPAGTAASNSPLLFAHGCCVRSRRLACVRSAAARSGTTSPAARARHVRAQCSHVEHDGAETAGLQKQIGDPNACSIRAHGLPDSRFPLGVLRVCGSARSFPFRSFFVAAPHSGANFRPQQTAHSFGKSLDFVARVPTAASSAMQTFLGRRRDQVLFGKRKAVLMLWLRFCTPHRTQRTRGRSTPAAAADSGARIRDVDPGACLSGGSFAQERERDSSPSAAFRPDHFGDGSREADRLPAAHRPPDPGERQPGVWFVTPA